MICRVLLVMKNRQRMCVEFLGSSKKPRYMLWVDERFFSLRLSLQLGKRFFLLVFVPRRNHCSENRSVFNFFVEELLSFLFFCSSIVQLFAIVNPHNKRSTLPSTSFDVKKMRTFNFFFNQTPSKSYYYPSLFLAENQRCNRCSM